MTKRLVVKRATDLWREQNMVRRNHVMQRKYWEAIDRLAEEVGAITQYGRKAKAAGHRVPSYRTLFTMLARGELAVIRSDSSKPVIAQAGEVCQRVANWLTWNKKRLPANLRQHVDVIVSALQAGDPDKLPGGLGE